MSRAGSIFAMTMVGAALLSSTATVRAVEITFLCGGVLKTTAEELLPEFQRSTGYHVKVIYTSIGFITQRVRNGEVADLAIVSPQQWEDLKSAGKIQPTTRVVIAEVGAGVFVKGGAAKPDISSVEAFKHALLNAKSIALVDPAAGGPVPLYVRGLFERLGISAESNRR